VHILILLLLSSMDGHAPTKVQPPMKAIKSYLYKRPASAPKKTIIPETTKVETLQKIENKEVPPKERDITNVEELPAKDVITEVITETISKEVTDPVVTASRESDDNEKQPLKSKVTRSFSALEQLSKLQSRINQKAMEQGLEQYQQHRSISKMHGNPIPVQHSKKQLSKEEKKKNRTMRLSSDLAIEKGDDGLCFVERDLTNVGMEGVKSVSAFSCGSSKFDKSFRAHMKKIKEKLGK